MKILIVEDDISIHTIMVTRLNLMKNVEIFSAFDGIEAWEKVEEHNPDLILLDIVMPRQNGLDFLKKLRKSKKFKGTDVFVLTNLSGIENRIKAKKLGIKKYFEKADTEIKTLISSIEELYA